MLKLEGGYM